MTETETETVTETKTDKKILADEQQQLRAWACHEARIVLANRNMLGGISSMASWMDIMYLARYILTGDAFTEDSAEDTEDIDADSAEDIDTEDIDTEDNLKLV